MIKTLGKRLYSSPTVTSTVGGLATAQIRDLVGSPAAVGKTEYKMPPYLKPKQFRPTRGCFSDDFIRKNYLKEDNPEDPYNYRGRAFTYMVKVPMWATCLASARVVACFLMSQFLPNKSSLALANIEVEIGHIPEGKTVTIIWRGKPVFLRHRTDSEIEAVRAVPMSELRDPQTDDERLADPKWAVLLAVCTHLGCVPVIDQGSYNAYFCPCHGSHYDHSGRIRKGPAPLNLEVATYKLLDDNTMFLGDLATLEA